MELDTSFDPSVSLEDLRQRMRDFVTARDWTQFHSPRNLVLAFLGEAGELAELFQWEGEVEPGVPGWSAEKRIHLGEELSDCLLYLIRLADRCGIDLPSDAIEKIEKNMAKYPAEIVRGSSAKYTAYKTAARRGSNAAANRISDAGETQEENWVKETALGIENIGFFVAGAAFVALLQYGVFEWAAEHIVAFLH